MLSSRLLAATLVAASSLSAQGLLIPNTTVGDGVTTGNSSNGFPWDRDSATPSSNDIRIQFSYDTVEVPFGMPVFITGVEFRAQEGTATWTGGTYGNCEIRCGGMGATDALSMTTTFAANYAGGIEPSPAYTGPVTMFPGTGNGAGIVGPTYISINFTSPVMYDPALDGDFLLDIAHDGTWTETGGATSGGAYTSDYSTSSQGALTRRMYNSGDWQAATGSGPFTSGSIVANLIWTPQSGTFANFTADTQATSPFGQVQFTDTTFTSDPGGIVAWDWDFDNDGTTDSTLQNPTYTYPTCGTFDVKLTVTDASANTNTITRTAYIESRTIALSYTISDPGPAPGAAVTFTNTSTTVDPGGITTTAWDFDGDNMTDATGTSVQWAYTAIQCGTPQDVTITCSDALCSASRTDVGAVTPNAPAPSFTTMVLAPATPIPVAFTDTSLGIEPTSTWDWDLDGDLVTDDTTQNPVFLYNAAGLYNVTLTVTNSCGSGTITEPINIIAGSPVCTHFAANNGQSGNFFDVTVTNPAGITIRAFDINMDAVTDSVEVWTIPGGFAGNQGSSMGWTLHSTKTVTGNGLNVATPMDVDDFCLPPGVYGMCVLCTSSTALNYRTGSGGTGNYVSWAGFDITITSGQGTSGFGGSTFDPRHWSGCIYYDVGTIGTYEQISTIHCQTSGGNIVGNTIPGGTVPTYGQQISFRIDNAPANEPLAFVMIGFVDVGGVDLGVIGMPGCKLHSDGILSFNCGTNALGVGTTTPFGIPNDPIQIGSTIYSQPFVRDPGANAFGAVTGVARKGVVGCP